MGRIQSPTGQPAQMNLDLSQATDIVCDNCGNATFQEVVLMKRLSAVASPTGKEANVPIPTFACNACGYVNTMFLPPFMRPASENMETGKVVGSTNGVSASSLILSK